MIDLHLTLFDFEQTLKWKVEGRKSNSQNPISNPNEIKITFQFLQKIDEQTKKQDNKPISFIVFRQEIVVSSQLQVVEAKFGLSTSEEFYQKREDLFQIVNKFIAFLYCGRLHYNASEYLTFFKLGIHFQCKELVIELLKTYPQQNLVKSCFMAFLVYILSNKFFEQFDLNLTLGIIEKLLLNNLETLKSHPQYDSERRDLTVRAIQRMTQSIFLQIAMIYLKHNKGRELTKLVNFLNIYGNPYAFEMERQYIQLMIDQIDEDLFVEIKSELSDQARSVFEKHLLDKANTKVCHFIHSKVCEIVNKQFVAHCGHKICLNCFFEYFIYKTIKIGEQQPLTEQKCQIQCLSRYIDCKICDQTFNTQDFQQLAPYFSYAQINQYLH